MGDGFTRYVSPVRAIVESPYGQRDESAQVAMDEHVITIRQVGEVARHACGCGLPLADRDAAARHATDHGLCPRCLGAGALAVGPLETGDCDVCGGSGRVTVEARVSESFVREMAGSLPDEFELTDVVAALEGRLPPGRNGVESVLSVAAGLIRYLEVQGRIVLCTAPDYLPGDGVRQRYGDPRWIRLP